MNDDSVSPNDIAETFQKRITEITIQLIQIVIATLTLIVNLIVIVNFGFLIKTYNLHIYIYGLL